MVVFVEIIKKITSDKLPRDWQDIFSVSCASHIIPLIFYQITLSIPNCADIIP